MVAHLAAQAAVRRSVAGPAFDASVNVLGGARLLDCCRRAGVRRVIYSSSGGAGYGDTDVLPTPEDHPAAAGVALRRHQGHRRALPRVLGRAVRASRASTLRSRTSTGPRQDPAGEAGVIAIFCPGSSPEQPRVVNGDGNQTRDYVYVEDVADANRRAP